MTANRNTAPVLSPGGPGASPVHLDADPDTGNVSMAAGITCTYFGCVCILLSGH